MNEAAFNVALRLGRFGPATVARSVAIAPWSNLRASPRLERGGQRQPRGLGAAATPAKVEPVQVLEAEEEASLRVACLPEVEHQEVAFLWAVQPWEADLLASTALEQGLARARWTEQGRLESRPR